MPDRPNLIVFLPDQLRPDFLSCYGADFVSTPAIDSIAACGTRFTRAVSSSPVCVPARSALLTGMHPLRSGVLNNRHALRPDYRQVGIRTIADLLAEDGFYTAAVGKMHFYPWDARNGFQYRVIAEDKRHVDIRDDYFHYLSQLGLRRQRGIECEGYLQNFGAITNPLPLEHSVDRFVGRAAQDFVRRLGPEGPFALFVTFPGPHCPYDPDEHLLANVDVDRLPPAIPDSTMRGSGIWQDMVATNRMPWNGVDYSDFPKAAKARIRHYYAASVWQIDREIDGVLSALREIGQADNTAIVVASDHGDYLGDHELIGKNSYYESAIRIPMIVRRPGQDSPAVCDELVDLYDLAPTMLRLLGTPVPDYVDAPMLPAPVIEGQLPRAAIVGGLSHAWMYRVDRYKLAMYATGERTLFDLETDPTEQDNLAGRPEFYEVYAELEAELISSVMRLTTAAADHQLALPPAEPNGAWAFPREGWRVDYPRHVGTLRL
jgi:arylsulfatase A-like enzyme